MPATVAVTFSGEDRTIPVVRGETFLHAAQNAGIDVMATCGGRGRCRSCRIKVLKGGVPPPTVMDRVQLGHDDAAEPQLLAIGAHVGHDRRVRSPLERDELLREGQPRDRREKFLSYTQIETLEEYVLAAQDKMEVTIFRRANEWKPEVLRLPEQEAHLSSLDFKLPLRDVYEGVKV